jgi:hydrogenase maturation protease
MSRLLVAGLGNEMRGDDAAGVIAARALAVLGARGVDILEAPADTLTLAAAIADHDEVVLIDAVAIDGEVGEVFVLDEDSLAKRSGVSGHGLSARDAIRLARAMGREPLVRVIGITGRCFELGGAPNPAVERAARDVAVWIKEMHACA